MSSSSSTSVSQTLSRIFSELPRERLIQRRRPRNAAGETDTSRKSEDPLPKKRRKFEGEHSSLLHSTDLIRLVSAFLDPFELQAWSCCCKATRDACSGAVKLDGIFRQFRILKRCADRVQSHMARHNNYGWNVVMNLLLEALKELRRVYGPYEVHPLHAAVVGKIIFLHLARRPRAPDAGTTLRDVWYNYVGRGDDGFYLSEYFVLGKYGDYFKDTEGVEFMKRYAPKNSEKFPPGPARVLSEEGCMPFINFFTREDESHTDQMGLSFPNTDASDKLDEIPAQIFCLNFQELPPDDEECVEWYEGLEKYEDCTTIAQAFCQHVPLSYGEQWDDWTQLLRAGWLKAHRIAPFDESSRGKTLWVDVIHSAGAELKLSETADNEDEDEAVSSKMEVLQFHRNNDGEARDVAREHAKIYLRQNHNIAIGSDFV